MTNLDDSISVWVSNAWASPAADLFFGWLSDRTFAAPLAVVLCVYLTWRNPRRGWAAWLALIAVVALGDLFGNGLKHLLEMPRPCFALGDRVRQIAGCTSPLAGMPSNHAVEYGTVAGFVAYLLRSRRAALALGLVAVLVCLSRIYLGKHFASQVLTGLVFGTAWGAVGAKVALRAVPFVRPLHASASATAGSAASAPRRA